MDAERLTRASAALIVGAGGAMQTTNLNKALFYFDLGTLLDEGATYTGTTFVALRRGPVVDHYKSVLIERFRRLPADFLVTEEERWAGFPSVTVRFVGPTVPDLGSDERDRRARAIGAWAGGRHAVEVSEFSHDNLGWRAAYQAREGATIDLGVAMQQLVDDDPWLRVELSDHSIRQLEAIDRSASMAF